MTEIPAPGIWLKQQRGARDLTQGGLAQLIGCPIRTIEKIETGEGRRSRRIIDLLAECLGVPAEEGAAFMLLAREEGWGNAPPPLMRPDGQATDKWSVSTAAEGERTGNRRAHATYLIGRGANWGRYGTLERARRTTGHAYRAAGDR